MTGSDKKRELPRQFVIELGKLFQAFRMYPPGTRHVQDAAARCAEIMREFGEPIRLTLVDEDVVVEEDVLYPVPTQLNKILNSFETLEWESMKFDPELGAAGLIEVMEHIVKGEPGSYIAVGFIAGSIQIVEDGGEEEDNTLAAGYLGILPMVQEMMDEIANGRKGSWMRAREVTRLITSHIVAGEDLFSPILEMKDYDQYTFTHALNVSALSLGIARRMDLPEKLLDAIGIGALCHDLGKTKISYEILRKPGRLNEEERAIMDRHPVDGASHILQMEERISPLVAVIAFQHHMRMDGTGYPELKVVQPPHPAAMMVAVADTYDAVRTVRPYQQNAMDQHSAMSVLLKEAAANRLHPVFVSIFARTLGLFYPGAKLLLDDGNEATILAEGEYDVLQPLVEIGEGGEIADLSLPGSPTIVGVIEGGEPPADPWE
ncbi:MAG: hypothetical protein C0609_05405 [Deltaproteobacteria bacterium]|nr:MAG: hypothetical protein C0609_05405 [Deltaproteobacteria bacterium]